MTSTHRTHGTPKHPPIGSLPLWGRVGTPMKKADAFFMGTRGGGSKHTAPATNTPYLFTYT